MKITCKIDKAIQELLKLDREQLYDINIKKHSEKRSLDANAYYWVLVTKIGNVLRASKEEVHLVMLKRYGQITTVCLPAEETIKGLVKYYEFDGAFKNKGKAFKTYKVYRPSSEMNKYEMGVLIDGVVSECHEMGIETLTPSQLLDLKNQWCEASEVQNISE